MVSAGTLFGYVLSVASIICLMMGALWLLEGYRERRNERQMEEEKKRQELRMREHEMTDKQYREAVESGSLQGSRLGVHLDTGPKGGIYTPKMVEPMADIEADRLEQLVDNPAWTTLPELVTLCCYLDSTEVHPDIDIRTLSAEALDEIEVATAGYA